MFVNCIVCVIVSLQFAKTPLDIAVDIGRNDICELLHDSSVHEHFFHANRTTGWLKKTGPLCLWLVTSEVLIRLAPNLAQISAIISFLP